LQLGTRQADNVWSQREDFGGDIGLVQFINEWATFSKDHVRFYGSCCALEQSEERKFAPRQFGAVVEVDDPVLAGRWEQSGVLEYLHYPVCAFRPVKGLDEPAASLGCW
jgi:hypothetical protein